MNYDWRGDSWLRFMDRTALTRGSKDRLERFLAIIDKRDQIILNSLSRPASLEEIAEQGYLTAKSA